MIQRNLIEPVSLRVNPHHLWNQQWLLLTVGEFDQGDFNAMTVGWGSMGTMWGKPFVQIVVRPTRYTYHFLQRFADFTLCAFPEEKREALQFLGTHSGRDGDKITESGLTPINSTRVKSPSYEEASLVLECRKLYWNDMISTHFLDPEIETNYPGKDYHRIYFGEIVAAFGAKSFQEDQG